MSDLAVRTTNIPGLVVIDLPVHGDSRGWFKENWQRAKMTALGLPDFGPVQQNISFNEQTGVTRGIHAEPWDKLVSVATGRVFAAWVDLRAGATHGRVVTLTLGPETAVFVPRGVGNAYQTLEAGTAYSYLVNDHWSPEAKERYTFVQLADPALGIDWPIPLTEAVVSDADRQHPLLSNARPVQPARPAILGAGGQLGKALSNALPDAVALTREQADLAQPETLAQIDWTGVDAIINAAAYTAVDAAETPDGRRQAWASNVSGVANLVRIARERQIPLVHISSDYVFDGTLDEHMEDEPFSPLGVYGQTKAAGDALVATWEQHYIVRTSWVVGQGRNFVSTMAQLAKKGVAPSVVADQFGRLSFTQDIAAGICHLLAVRCPYGTYNLTSSGPVLSWADIAAEVFRVVGASPDDVRRVSTQEYGLGKDMAPRPVHSALNLDKIRAAGFCPPASTIESVLALG
ncbi:sugar nucleotide-binding protein [Gephyromycinifex aptenodytis]|uniref:sugar nucleotide-binding protein n=1 Tax=Gephyromycinifex aptenodytis TaxID=2716227 RepID=UPI0014459FF4|nr:bifunctional dTDP-4-dehydrorhamnose 3,5-epimerase family protein/NAD(P)-dependent oxidoreductase [Gephyromycinifex aptenodytis]